jgi:hypothetical protein
MLSLVKYIIVLHSLAIANALLYKGDIDGIAYTSLFFTVGFAFLYVRQK